MEDSDWWNIQDIVRISIRKLESTCACLSAEVKAKDEIALQQGEKIRSLELQVAQLAAEKASKSEAFSVRTEDQNIRAQLSTKASKNDLKELYDDITVATTCSSAQYESIKKELNELKSWVQQALSNQATENREEMKSTRRQIEKEMETGLGELKTTIQKQIASLRKEIDTIRNELDERPSVATLDHVLAQKDINMLKIQEQASKKMTEHVESQVEAVKKHMEEQLEASGEARHANEIAIAELQAEIKSMSFNVEDHVDRVSRSELLQVCGTKVSSVEFEGLEQQLLENTQEVHGMKELIKEVVQVLNKKAFKADLRKSSQETLERTQNIEESTRKKIKSIKEDALKSSEHVLQNIRKEIENVCVLLDGKASIEDVNKALAQLSLEQPVQERTQLDDDVMVKIRQLEKEISAVVQPQGRWIWSSNKTMRDAGVPWNIECVNTSTENFIWERDSDHLVTVLPGLYQLQLAFFGEEADSVKILVNGEPIIITSKPNRPIPSAAKRIQKIKHIAGSITSSSFNEFIALPPRSTLKVLYHPNELRGTTQGFLGLKKL